MSSILSTYSFKSPWMLLLLGLVFLGYFLWFRRRPTQASIRMSQVLDGENKSVLERTSWLPMLLKALAIALMIIALARPQHALNEEKIEGEGIDIILAMDISGSMLAMDFSPNRIEVAKRVATDFIKNRPHDRIGLTLYAADAFTQCPPTTDHAVLMDYMNLIHTSMLTPGTAIGMGLSTALSRLQHSDSKSKIVILLTDGENNAGYIDPMTAAEMAQKMGVRVYTIGIGSEGQVRTVTGRNIFGKDIIGTMNSRIDEELLTSIADMTDGKYYRARNENNLRAIYNEIDTLEKSTVEVSIQYRYKDLFRGFLVSGLALWFIAFLLDKLVYNLLNRDV